MSQNALLLACAAGIQTLVASSALDTAAKASILDPINAALTDTGNADATDQVATVMDTSGELQEGEVLVALATTTIVPVSNPTAPAAVTVAAGLLAMFGGNAEMAVTTLFCAKGLEVPSVEMVTSALTAGDAS